MTINLNVEKVKVARRYLTNNTEEGFISAYLIAARCLPSRPILFTVHLENGAVYSGLPIEAIYGKDAVAEGGYVTKQLQPWSCLEGPVQYISYSHMAHYEVFSTQLNITGRYIGTIDYHGAGLAQDPEQHKTHNLILPDRGQLMAMPNNYCKFYDNYFTGETKITLKRNSTFWRTD